MGLNQPSRPRLRKVEKPKPREFAICLAEIATHDDDFILGKSCNLNECNSDRQCTTRSQDNSDAV